MQYASDIIVRREKRAFREYIEAPGGEDVELRHRWHAWDHLWSDMSGFDRNVFDCYLCVVSR